MTEERKRLMALLGAAHNIACEAKLFEGATYSQQLGEEADYLLANGVTFNDAATNQRLRAQYAEDFICKLCAEDEREENDGISTMIKRCCNWFPECGKFKLRSGWIPVTERLPENDTAAIVATDSGMVFPCLYAYDGWDLWEMYTVNVTHWMPLPEPPKEDV